jgi:hypothetical protein
MIAAMFPTVPKLETFARGWRPGWTPGAPKPNTRRQTDDRQPAGHRPPEGRPDPRPRQQPWRGIYPFHDSATGGTFYVYGDEHRLLCLRRARRCHKLLIQTKGGNFPIAVGLLAGAQGGSLQ